MTSCFVVLGELGEYSDRKVWAQAVFHTEHSAKLYIQDLDNHARQWRAKAIAADFDWLSLEALARQFQFLIADSDYQDALTYTTEPPRYFIQEVPLL